MFQPVQTFMTKETGAVSADWTVLTAWVILLAIAAATTVVDVTATLGSQIGADVAVINGDSGGN